MDPNIIEDTAPVHWSLDQQEMTEFLEKPYPDSRLFPPSNAASNTACTINNIISNMQTTQHRLKNRWAYFPEVPNPEPLEERIAEFFNGIIQHVPHSHTWTSREYHGYG